MCLITKDFFNKYILQYNLLVKTENVSEISFYCNYNYKEMFTN